MVTFLSCAFCHDTAGHEESCPLISNEEPTPETVFVNWTNGIPEVLRPCLTAETEAAFKLGASKGILHYTTWAKRAGKEA